MMRRFLLIVATATCLLCPWPAHAQAKDRFVQGLVDFINASGSRADDGRALTNAVQAMADGLAAWDASVAGVESGLASAIGGAPRPMAAKMRATLATVYLERGRIDAALAQFDLASELDPTLAGIDAIRALALTAAGRATDAAESYRRAWKADPENPLQAYRVLRSFGATRPDLPDLARARNTMRTAVLNGSGSGDRQAFPTLDLLDEASVTAPIFALAAYADAFALVRQGGYEQAVTRLRTLVAADPLVTDKALQAPDVRDAIARLKGSDSAAAIVALASAATRHPESAEVHRILGVAYLAASQHQKSLEHFRAAARLNPRDERARLLIADALVGSNELSQARDVAAETVTAFPQSGQARWVLGELHQGFGDQTNALQSYEAAARLSPFVGASHLQTAIGRLHHNQLNFEAAVLAYSRGVTAAPNSVTVHIELCEVFRAQDALDQALSECLVAAVLDPSNARSFAATGQIDATAGRDDEAVAMLRKATALDPDHREAHYALSRAFLRLNRPDEARQELEIFERLQSKAMDDERRRFQDNLRKIEETLKTGGKGARGQGGDGDAKGPPR
jgi:tetratricopeptide (TPR) repeat protein